MDDALGLNLSAVTVVSFFTMHYSDPFPLITTAGDMSLPLRDPEGEEVPPGITKTGGIGAAGVVAICDEMCQITDLGIEVSMSIQKAVAITKEDMRATVDRTKGLDTILMIMIKNCAITTTVDREREKRNKDGRDMNVVVASERERREIIAEMNDFILKTKTAGAMNEVARARTRIHANAKTPVPGNSWMDMTESVEVIVRTKNELQCMASHRVMILSRTRNEAR